MSVGITSCRAGLKSVMVCVKVEFYPRTYFVYADELSKMRAGINDGQKMDKRWTNHGQFTDNPCINVWSRELTVSSIGCCI